MYGAIFAFSGASNGCLCATRLFNSDFKDGLLEGVTVGAPSFYRDDSIDGSNINLFGNPQAMWDRAAKMALTRQSRISVECCSARFRSRRAIRKR